MKYFIKGIFKIVTATLFCSVVFILLIPALIIQLIHLAGGDDEPWTEKLFEWCGKVLDKPIEWWKNL